MTNMNAEQVKKVRVRLLHHDAIARVQQRTHLSEAELSQVVAICVERNGLHSDIEGWIDSQFWNWRCDPRMTLIEFLRQRQP